MFMCTGLQKIFEVRRREDEHLPCPIAAQKVVTLTRPGHFDPAREVFFFLPRPLGEEIVGDAEGQLTALVQFFDDGVILRVILIPATSVDDAREAEPVEFAHEVARGIHLVFRRQLRAFGERRVKNGRVGPRDEQPGGIATAVALNFAAGRIRRVLCVRGQEAIGRQNEPGQARCHGSREKDGRPSVEQLGREQAKQNNESR